MFKLASFIALALVSASACAGKLEDPERFGKTTASSSKASSAVSSSANGSGGAGGKSGSGGAGGSGGQ